MKRAIKILFITLLVAPVIYIAAKITILNPAWVIGMKYPNAERQLHTVNSPDLHVWSAISGLFGVPMTDPDHSLTVTINRHPTLVRLDDFTGADELYVRDSKVSDISAYWDSTARLSGAVFIGCDFTSMPQEQRALLKPYSDKVPDSYYVPYETKKKAEQDGRGNGG
jgi:hypothetical protein